MHKNPAIWVITETGNVSGRRNALEGVARHLSDNIQLISIEDTQATQITPPSDETSAIQSNFHDVQDPLIDEQLPDIILTDLNCYPDISGHTIESYDGDMEVNYPNSVFVVGDMQFLNWNSFAPECDLNLSPHNLTEQVISEEAQKLKEHLTTDTPVIAIMISEISPQESIKDIQNKLTQAIQYHSNADIYLCSAPRTQPDIFKTVCQEINDQAETNVYTYNWQEEQGQNNPYIGLLQHAEHMILVGESHSILSERLFTGQSIYTYYDHPEEVAKHIAAHSNMTDKTHIKDLKTDDISNGLTTVTFAPVDITPLIAQSVEARYEQHLNEKNELAHTSTDPEGNIID